MRVVAERVVIIECDLLDHALVQLDHDRVERHDDARLASELAVDHRVSRLVEHTHALGAVRVAVTMLDVRSQTAGLDLERGTQVLERVVSEGGQTRIGGIESW